MKSNENQKTSGSELDPNALLADSEYDKAMSSFKMVDGIPMDHDDHLGEIDGELVVYHADETFDFVS
jgi:hypothetical protein